MDDPFELIAAERRALASFGRANQRMTAARASKPIGELTALLREHAESRFVPPAMDWHAPLSDVLIHREDIAVPLRLPSDRPVEFWRHVLDFLVSPPARRGFVNGRLPGVRLVATDVDWASGDGPEVTGPAASLALAISGPPPRCMPSAAPVGNRWRPGSVEPRTVGAQLQRG